MMNTLNVMIAIFSYRLVKTDFLGGWKSKQSVEVSYDIQTSDAKKFIDWNKKKLYLNNLLPFL